MIHSATPISDLSLISPQHVSMFGRAVLLSFAAVTAYGFQFCNSSAERKPVIWIHLHKAGGTMICKFAKINNEVVIEPEVTCNLEPENGALAEFHVPDRIDGNAQAGQQRHRIDCAQRLELYRCNGFTWGQIEREVNLEDIGCNDSFMYGIMLRKPMDLMVSNLNFDKWNATNVVAWLQDAEVNIEYPCGEACKHAGWPQLGWQVFDNFAVRTLNGYDVWRQPPGHVKEKDLEQAKQRLVAMDVVMVLEDLDQDKVQLEKVMGWKNTELTQIRHYSHSQDFTGDQYAFLKQLNKYDDALYTYAREIARQRRERFA